MTPLGRTYQGAFSPSPELPQVLHGTWLESESFTYPSGGFHRRAFVELVRNPNAALDLPYGERRIVVCSIPDTYFSIPARARIRGRIVRGFISVLEPDTETARFTFTPEATAG